MRQSIPRLPAAPVSRPHVVAHAAVSVDGATTGFDVDVQRYYSAAATWREDVTLTGADTLLAQEEQLAAAPKPGPIASGPLLAVVDSRGRIQSWAALRDCGFWRDVVALHSASTPTTTETRRIVRGADRVDLAAALQVLQEQEGARLVRVDSGGQLIGALLQHGLVDEISLLVHPQFADRAPTRWYGPVPPPAATLHLRSSEPVGAGIVWLRYDVGLRPTTTRCADRPVAAGRQPAVPPS